MNTSIRLDRKNTKQQIELKISHWVVIMSFLVLAYSGIEILMVHPRLFLADIFGNFQSASTIHFFLSIALVLFLFVHLAMVLKPELQTSSVCYDHGKTHEK